MPVVAAVPQRIGKIRIFELLTDVRFGSKADIGLGPRDVRFTPESGHRNLASAPQNRSAGANANTPAKLRVCFTDMARGPGGPKGKRWGEPLSLRRMAERHRIGGDDLLADRPQRDPGKLQMRPGKGNADDSHREYDRGDEMAERQPPAGEHEPR